MIDKIFILNHIDFIDRREYITERLDSEKINYFIIDSHHPDTIDYDEVMKNWEKYNNIFIEQIGGLSYQNFPKKISPGSLSLVLKHMECWKNQIKNNYETILILEDDCDIPKGFNQYINEISREFNILKNEENIEIAMVGTAFNLISPNKKDNAKIHYHEYQKTRCTHAYLISKSGAEKMINEFKNLNLPIDYKMNEVIQLLSIKVGWCEPGLVQKIF